MKRKQIQDFEVPAVLYLLDILRKNHFNTTLEKAPDKKLQDFLSIANPFDNDELSIQSFKNIIRLIKFDYGYRPKYKSIEFLMLCHFQEPIDFDEFKNDHDFEIGEFMNKIPSYTIQFKNSNIKSLPIHQTWEYQFGKIHENANVDDSALKLIKGIIKDEIGISSNSRSKIGKNTLRERTEIRTRLKEIRKQENLEKIIKKATAYIESNELKSKTDKEWIENFFEIAENCSNENLQYLWAKLLADHIVSGNRPSKFALNRLQLMEQHHALIFSFLCNNSFIVGTYNELFDRMFFIQEDYYNKSFYSQLCDIKREDLEFLDDIGLIEFDYIDMKQGFEYELDFFGKKSSLVSEEGGHKLNFVSFTYMGEELFDVANFGPDEKGFNLTLDFINNLGILIK